MCRQFALFLKTIFTDGSFHCSVRFLGNAIRLDMTSDDVQLGLPVRDFHQLMLLMKETSKLR